MELQGVRKVLRVTLLVSLIAAILLIIDCSLRRHLDFVRGQLILTFLALAIGSIMALIDTWVLPHLPRLATTALAVLAASQLAFHVLVWTDAKKNDLFWRFWWIFMVASIASSHLLGLKKPTDAPRNWLDRFTPACALISGLILALAALKPNLLATPPLWYWIAYGLPALGSAVGSWILWRRRRPRQDGRVVPMALWAKTAWVLASQAAVFLTGFYLGSGSEPQAFEVLPSVGSPGTELEFAL